MKNPSIKDEEIGESGTLYMPTYYTVRIGECEYILAKMLKSNVSTTMAITHKGDCSNPIHKSETR